MSERRENVIRILGNVCGPGLNVEMAMSSENWYRDGLLDSLKQMRLILALEESLAIRFPFSKLGRQHFQNLDALLRTIDEIAGDK